MKKLWFAGMAALILGVLLSIPAAASIPFVLGDLTNDGNVTAEDSTLLNRYFAGYYPDIIPFDIDKADIDGDGYLTRPDGMRLARYAAGWNEGREYFYSRKTGFAAAPQMVADGTVGYKTGLAGTVYYYYSRDGKNPAASEFFDNYDYISEKYKGEVQTDGMYATMTPDASYMESYPYMVFMFEDETGKTYVPVLVDLNDTSAGELKGNGFSTAPYLADETTIKFVAGEAGTLYWCYVKEDTALTSAEFKKIYSETAGTYCGNAVIASGRTLSFAVKKEYIQEYPYVAFMIKNEDGGCYVPVVVKMAETGETGFAIEPYILGDSVYFKTEKDGEVWYYFSEDGSAVSSSDFEEYYNDVSKSYLYGMIDVTSSKVNYFDIDEDVDLDKYSYIVIAFLSDDNNSDNRKFNYPVVLEVEDADIRGTGMNIDGVDENSVIFTTLINGRVYYYFTKSIPSVSSGNFYKKYDDASSYDKDDYSCEEDEVFDVEYDTEDGYKYLVICVEVEDTDGDSVYLSPVIVNLSDHTSTEEDDDDGATTSKTGLSFTDIDVRNKVITMTPDYDGTVTVSLYKDGKWQSDIGTIEVSEDESFDFNYSLQSTIINLLVSNGSDVEIVFQLKNSDETYKSVRIPVFE